METYFPVAIRPKETYTVKSTIHMQRLVPHISGTTFGALNRIFQDIGMTFKKREA